MQRIVLYEQQQNNEQDREKIYRDDLRLYLN